MKITGPIRICLSIISIVLCQSLQIAAALPIRVDTPRLLTQQPSLLMSNRCPFTSSLQLLRLSVVLCLASAARASTEAAPSPREIIPFDAGWRFHLGDDPAARQLNFDDTGWRALDVPHDWSIEGPINKPPDGEGNGGYFSHGIGWYRKHFTLPAAAGKKVVIEFDGVYMNSEVWINGQFLGRRPYGFIGFRYDLTEFLKTNGSPNVLAVRVDDSPGKCVQQTGKLSCAAACLALMARWSLALSRN
jgi:hypothetical protein